MIRIKKFGITRVAGDGQNLVDAELGGWMSWQSQSGDEGLEDS